MCVNEVASASSFIRRVLRARRTRSSGTAKAAVIRCIAWTTYSRTFRLSYPSSFARSFRTSSCAPAADVDGYCLRTAVRCEAAGLIPGPKGSLARSAARQGTQPEAVRIGLLKNCEILEPDQECHFVCTQPGMFEQAARDVEHDAGGASTRRAGRSHRARRCPQAISQCVQLRLQVRNPELLARILERASQGRVDFMARRLNLETQRTRRDLQAGRTLAELDRTTEESLMFAHITFGLVLEL